jgi:hypothetical protein
MADPTPRQLADELAALRATVRAQGAELARQRRRPRRFAPVALAALLVALVPLATLAAGPFTDLTPGSVHNANIQAIADAGITTGCNPPDNTAYCPNDLVTREQMASFLARAAGLGTNPPVANAKTAQTAQNAGAVGGYPAGALNRVAFSANRLTPALPESGAATDLAQVTLTIPGTAPQAVAVRGAFNPYGLPTGGSVTASLRQDGGPPVGAAFFPYVLTDETAGVTAFAEWVFAAAPGTHTYTLVGQSAVAGGDLPVGSNITLIATTHPFGSTGNPGATDLPTGPPPPPRP